jgi:tripartite-type tricarboxylate transporter receptor subunit TctC
MKNHKKSVTRRLMLSALAAVTLGLPAFANSDFPSKHITFVVPFPAGGGTDTFARPLAAILDQQLGGKGIIIDNRGGAGGTLGAGVAAKMPADGYTFFIGATHHTIAPSFYPNLTYDLTKDFVPVAVIAVSPHVVVVNPKVISQTNLKDFIAYAKENPDKINFASAGNGTTHHMAGELFKNVTGTNLTHLPYRGAGPAMQDLVAGQVQMMFDGLGTSASQINAGTLKALAIASNKRSSAIPDVPTAAEAGVAGYEVSTWYAIFAIKGTPQAIIDKMAAEVKKALATPRIQDFWTKNGSEIPNLYGVELEQYVQSEIVRWSKIAK